MRFFQPSIAVATVLLFCARAPEKRSADKPEQQSQRKVTEWTAGIVTVSTQLPPDTFALVRDVRAARHGQFDRIVIEFSSSALPGYRIEYIDEPVRLCGSGKPLQLPGDGWLMIRLTSARMHAQGESTVANRDLALELPVILRLVATCDFENVVTWVAAVSAPNRYRVQELKNPARLVVDIRH
jgi:hypothetical protein